MEKRYLSIKETAEYLGVAEGTLYVWKCHREIPCLKIGRLVKFDIQEIETWLKDKRMKIVE